MTLLSWKNMTEPMRNHSTMGHGNQYWAPSTVQASYLCIITAENSVSLEAFRKLPEKCSFCTKSGEYPRRGTKALWCQLVKHTYICILDPRLCSSTQNSRFYLAVAELSPLPTSCVHRVDADKTTRCTRH